MLDDETFHTKVRLLARDLYEAHGRESVAIASGALSILAKRAFKGDPARHGTFAAALTSLVLLTPEEVVDEVLQGCEPPKDPSTTIN